MKHSMFIVLLISAGIIASATGLKCYRCSYLSNVGNIIGNEPKCQDENILDASEFLLDCPTSSNAACVKTSGESKDTVIVSRDCASASEATAMECSSIQQGNEKVSVCYCDTDGCNGSTSLKVTSALILAIPAYLAKFYYY